MWRIYFPMTASVIVPGHIKALKQLSRRGHVTIGLLTSKALKGYKQERMPFKDRKYILKTLATAIGSIRVVPQDSLNPSRNILKYKCNAIASGDGWEQDELQTIKKLNLKIININSRSSLHSSDILNEHRTNKKRH